MEDLRAGVIMIACGEATGGAASPYPSFSQLLNKLPPPLAFGGTDVDLITGTETSPHITQSETYTSANPDNPNQICRRLQRLPRRGSQPVLRRIMSPPTAALRLPASPTPVVKVPSPIPLATLLFCTTNQLDLVHGLAGWNGQLHIGRVQVDHSCGSE